MSDFRDPDLENMLGRLSGAYPDSNVAYATVAKRVRQVKRRRAFVASAAACVTLFGVGALAVSGGNSAQNLQPASESSTESSSATSVTTKDDESSSSVEATESSVDESTSSQPDASVAGQGSNSGPGSSSSNSGHGSSGSNSGTSHPGSGNSGTSNPGPSSSETGNSSTSEPAVNAPNSTTTYSSDGGKITVALTDGMLSLVSSDPAAGFSAKVDHDRADRVEVEFTDGTVTWDIRVDLVNGQPVQQVTSR